MSRRDNAVTDHHAARRQVHPAAPLVSASLQNSRRYPYRHRNFGGLQASAAIAVMFAIGQKWSTVSNFLAGRRELSKAQIKAFNEAFRVPAFDLID
jgi:hypothetical protein